MEKGNESILVDIRQIPEIYRSIFAAYPSFNRVQSTVFHDVFNSDHSVTVAAPTGSGKTVIFELAIIRQLIAAEKSKYANIFQIVYISPMKALCEERLIDWHKKFSPFGINCISITGDSDYLDLHSLSNHNLIITTPEKWDSITRRWKENKRLIQVIKLFMIDEVHLLNEENRGATLEAVVCRMKTIQCSLFENIDNEQSSLRQRIRFLAVSATFPNIKDVGDWLEAKYYSFESSMRPVKLKTFVLGFNYSRSCSLFKFDISLNYRLPGLILKYSNGKPTLIFCSTRKSVEMAAKQLVQSLTIPLSDSQKENLMKAASSISDTKLRSSVVYGIGYHHGGLLPETRSVIEQLFRNGELPVLVTTSTLATGVNLPAHLVIIKSTKFYDKGGFQDYSASALLQMLGRAGRPQFDTEATALILTSTADRAKFEKMIDGKENIESNLHRHLTEHLNAEIVLRTITDLDVAMRWLSSTFLYIRARKNPRHYNIALGMTTDKIDKKLLEICQIDLNKLVRAAMATMDEDVNISPTFLGTLMAKYYISFESMKLLKSINGNEMLQQVLSLISKCKEFSDMRLRVDEKKCLNLLNKNKNENSIRFPFNGKIKTLDMKINCIIQAVFGCLEIEDQSIVSEAFRIMRLGERLCKCLIEYLESKDNCYMALLNATVLWKCFRAQLWENSKYIAKQFPGIGLVTSKQLVNADKTTFEKIIKTNPREIEIITKKKPPFGNKIVDLSKSIPRYEMKLEKCRSATTFNLKITLTLLNPDLDDSTFLNINSVMCLLVGNNLNHILLHERYMHSYMLENTEVVRFVELNLNIRDLTEVYCSFVSEDLVGIDLSETFFINEKSIPDQLQGNHQVSKSGRTKKSPKLPMKTLDSKYSNLVQTYIDKYMKCKKNVTKNQPVLSNNENAEKLSAAEENWKKDENVHSSRKSVEIGNSKISGENPNRYTLHQFDETITESPKNKYSKNVEQETSLNEEKSKSARFPSDQNENFRNDPIGLSDNQQEMNNIRPAALTTDAGSDLGRESSEFRKKNFGETGENEKGKEEYNEQSRTYDENDTCNNSKIDEIVVENTENKSSENYEQRIASMRSFTDEEILESVEFLLDQDENDKKDLSDGKQESRNNATAPAIKFLGSDLDEEFSKFYDKYGKIENTKGTSGNKKLTEENNNHRITGRNKINGQSRNASKEVKIHSVGSFENSLFNPKPDALSLFRYQPPKRLSRNNDPPSAPESKRKKLDTSNEKVTEDMMDNLEKYIGPSEKESLQYSKSIKWRSPLVYSPPVKFSPKMSSSFSFSVPMPKNNDSENSHDWSLNTVETAVVTSSAGATPDSSRNKPRARTQNQGMRFLLSDREHNSSEKPLNNTMNNMSVSQTQTPRKSQQIQDFFSSSFLEDLGYADKQKMTSNMRCYSQKSQDLSTGAYYHDMVAKNAQAQKNVPVQQPQKPFFLSQNHLTLPPNNLGNNMSIGPKANPQWSQSIGRRSFAPHQGQTQSMNTPTATVTRNFDNSWIDANSSQCYNIPANVAPPEYEYAERNALNASISNGDHNNFLLGNSQHNAANMNNQFAYQQIPKYPVGIDNREFFTNPRQQPLLPNNFRENMPKMMPNLLPTQSLDPRCVQDGMVPYSNSYVPELDRSILNKENLNYHADVQFRNIPPQRNTQGFFLNQPAPAFYDRPRTAPMWNSLCSAHRILNCYYCTFQQNMSSAGVQTMFNRTNSFVAPPMEEFDPATELPNDYFNNSSFMSVPRRYIDGNSLETSFLERGGPHTMTSYDQSVNRIPHYDSNPRNTFGGQNLNIQGGMAHQEFPRQNNCNENSGSTGERKINKTFMLSKFLNSFDESLKTHQE